MNLTVAVLPNVEAPVTPAANILTPTLARAVINPAHADQATQLPAPDQNHVLAVQLPVLATNAPKIPIPVIITTITTITPIQEQPRLLLILMLVNQLILLG